MSDTAGPEPWQLLSSRWLLDHPFAALVEDEYRLPHGRNIRWVRFADEREGRPRLQVAGAICQRADGQVLVARQWNPAPQEVVEEFPGGAGEPGESAEDCVRRELMEEVGIHAGALELLGEIMTGVRRQGTRISIFLATELTEDRWLEGDPNEQIEWSWYPPTAVDEAIRTGRFTNSTLLAAWALYRLRYP